MTLDEMVIQLQAWIPDFTGLTHTPADLENLLEQAANVVAALTLGYERSAIFSGADSPDALIAGTREYRLAGTVGQVGLGLTDVLKVLHIHLDGKALQQILPGQYATIDPAAISDTTLRYWYEFAGRVGFLPPTPAAVVSSYELELTYAATVGTWTSGESVMEAAFQELMPSFAYLKAKLREEQWQDAAVAFMAWFDQIQVEPMRLDRSLTRRVDFVKPSTAQKRLRRRAS